MIGMPLVYKTSKSQVLPPVDMEVIIRIVNIKAGMADCTPGMGLDCDWLIIIKWGEKSRHI